MLTSIDGVQHTLFVFLIRVGTQGCELAMHALQALDQGQGTSVGLLTIGVFKVVPEASEKCSPFDQLRCRSIINSLVNFQPLCGPKTQSSSRPNEDMNQPQRHRSMLMVCLK